MVSACLAAEPAQRPGLDDLALSLQQWLARAGQRAEADKLIASARNLLKADLAMNLIVCYAMRSVM